MGDVERRTLRFREERAKSLVERANAAAESVAAEVADLEARRVRDALVVDEHGEVRTAGAMYARRRGPDVYLGPADPPPGMPGWGAMVEEARPVVDNLPALVAELRREERPAEEKRGGRVVRRVRRGKKVLVDAREAVETRAKWMRDRAAGQHRRFRDVAHCGAGVVHVSCSNPVRGPDGSWSRCGHSRGVDLGCSSRRLCVRCRERLTAPRRDRFARARDVVLRRFAAPMGLLRRARPGGRYSEKHLTLTLPDGLVAGTKERVDTIFVAWRAFSNRLMAWFRERRKTKGEMVWWFRGFEWTAGSDGKGHPHFHVWLLCPYLPKDLVRYLWTRALHDAGVPVWSTPADPTGGLLDAHLKRRWRSHERPGDGGAPWTAPWLPLVIVDVREVTVRRKVAKQDDKGLFRFEVMKGGEQIKGGRSRLELVDASGAGSDLVGYIEGWVVSERDACGRVVGTDVWAALYEACEGRRQVQASRGFLALGARACACPECGTAKALTASVIPWSSPDVEEWRAKLGVGPPSRSIVGIGPALRKVRAGPGNVQVPLPLLGLA